MGATLAAFVLYLAVILVIGAVAAKYHTGSTDDFFIGGRKMNQWVVAISAVASGRSAWLILGLSGIAYKLGVSACWAVVGYILAELFLFAFLGKRLRRFTQSRDVVTIPGFLEERFDDRRHWVCAAATVIVAFFFFVYIAAQLMGGGKALGETFGMPDIYGVLLTAGIVLLYTALGGFVAVSWTDVVQAGMMILALVVLPIVAFVHLGGPGAVFAQLAASEFGVKGLDAWALGLGGIVGFIGIGLGSPGNPHILVRYMSVSDPRRLRKAALVGTVWNVVMAWGAVFAGLAARAIIESRPDLSLPLKAGAPDFEKGFVILAGEIMHPVLFGFVTAAIFAAIMSTIDSQLLVISSSISRDFYKRIFSGTASEKTLLLVSRASVACVLIAAILLGSAAKETVFWLVLFAWAGLGAAIGPVMLLSIYWRRMTLPGALAGIATGTAATIGWKLAWQKCAWFKAHMLIKYELVPGFLLALLAIVLVSLLTRPPEDVAGKFAAMRP